MTEFTAIVSVLIGLVIGFVAGRATSRGEDASKLHKELNAKRKELETIKRDMTDHFSSTAIIMEQLDEQYQRLYQHMSEQSQKLTPQPVLFRQENGDTLPQVDVDPIPESQPLDYSGTASGLLSDQKRTS